MIILVLALAGLVSCLKKGLKQEKSLSVKKSNPESPNQSMNDSLLSE